MVANAVLLVLLISSLLNNKHLQSINRRSHHRVSAPVKNPPSQLANINTGFSIASLKAFR